MESKGKADRFQQAMSRFIPIVSWLPECSWETARADVVAGIALAGLLIPEGMAYAGIAGVPPQVGLYAALFGMFVYAIFGTSRQLAVTSTSSSAAMLAALVAPIALSDSGRYMMLVATATIAAGAMFMLGGLLRLGAVSEFISKPVLKGFVFGLGLTIMVKQAHKLMGIPAGKGNFFHQSWHVITSLSDVNPWTLAVGSAAIVVMVTLGVVAPRVPSALIVLVLGIVSVSWFGLTGHGVEIVGKIQAGVPALSSSQGLGRMNLQMYRWEPWASCWCWSPRASLRAAHLPPSTITRLFQIRSYLH
jgi:MFS superfamily sulfate permease-like transporter